MARFRRTRRAAARVVTVVRRPARRARRVMRGLRARISRRVSTRSFVIPVISLFAVLYVVTQVLTKKLADYSNQNVLEGFAEIASKEGEGKRMALMSRALEMTFAALRANIWPIIGVGALVAGVRYLRRAARINTRLRLGPVAIDPLG